MHLRFLNNFFTFSFFALLVWLIGLYFFSVSIEEKTENIDLSGRKFEALIVLTGGEDRVETALDLFEKGHAYKLFISGVASPDALKKRIQGHQLLREKQDCCITLDERAATTNGNALESRIWIKKNHIGSILLLTSNYHMPRSLMEFKYQLPTLEITPYAMRAKNVPLQYWWQRQGTRRLIVLEYNKFLIASAKYYIGQSFNDILTYFSL